MSGGNTFQFTPPQQHLLTDQMSTSHGSVTGSPSNYQFLQQPQQLQYCFGSTASKQTVDAVRTPVQLKFTICPLEEQEAEKSDSGSSYSSMEALNMSSSSLVSDACLNPIECRRDAVVFPFESIKDDTEASTAASTGNIPAYVGSLEEPGSRSMLLQVSPEHLNHDHRRISLPDEVPKQRFSLLRNRLSASARNFLSKKESSSSGSSGGSGDSINCSVEDVNRLAVATSRSHKSGSLDCQFLALSSDHARRAKSVESENFKAKEKLESPRKQSGRKSPLEVIRSSLHLDKSPIRKRVISPLKEKNVNVGDKTNERDALPFDPEVRSLVDMKVGSGCDLGSVLSLPEKIKMEGDEVAMSTTSMSGSIPLVVIHSPQSASSLSCDRLTSGHVARAISSSRTSPAPLTDLFQESTLQKFQSKPIIQRVASMDSAKTVVHTHGLVEMATSELDIKTSDSNDKSGSGPLSLPLTVNLRTSPKKVAGGKSSSSGDASFKAGKSSSSSSESKKKKTSSWYNPKKIVLSPSYKSRSEDFKRIFKALPTSERLIVEYSCALQKDILIQGRMYVSQNWICFYANIFRWETILMIRCQDIVKLTKEKTARVIPNAIQICTRDDRYFFASFGARDKVFIQLDLVRKNAINELRMSKSEFWSWVHLYYGDELGLTSDDDDYMPVTPEDKSKFQAYLQNELGQSQEGTVIEIAKEALEDVTLSQAAPASTSSAPPTSVISKRGALGIMDLDNRKTRRETSLDYHDCGQHPDELPHTESASSEDDEEDEEIVDYCASHSHFSIEVLDEAFNMSVDDVFHHCFSDSQIYREFVKAKKTFDVRLNPWSVECDEEGNDRKVRNISYTLTLDFSIGPKHSPSTEKQMMHKESEPGRFYLVDTECINEGIPYGENFFITNRYCISRLSSKRSRLKITSQINYKKNVWGFIKNFLEKNVTAGIITSFNVLADLLRLESDRQLIPMTTASSQLQRTLTRNKFLRRRRVGGVCEGSASAESGFNQSHPSTPIKPGSATHSRTSSVSRFKLASDANQQPTVDSLIWFVCTVLVILMLFNGMLFYKLWCLESTATSLLKSKLNEHRHPAFSHQIERDGMYLDKKMTEESFQKSKLDGRLRNGMRSTKRKIWHDPDVDQWKNILLTSIRLMDHMRASLVELRNNIVELEQNNLKMKRGRNTRQKEGGAEG